MLCTAYDIPGSGVYNNKVERKKQTSSKRIHNDYEEWVYERQPADCV